MDDKLKFSIDNWNPLGQGCVNKGAEVGLTIGSIAQLWTVMSLAVINA